LQEGEHIAHAVVREVKEETGIDTEFMHIVCMRHWHGYRHGKSDIYFVTRLRPLSRDITMDPVEIADCRWMDVTQYLESPDTHQFNRRIVEAAVQLDRALEADGLVLAHGQLPDYGSPDTHELFFPHP
jgi:NADH pyrophosphatase NudC (nudix superfamily)